MPSIVNYAALPRECVYFVPRRQLLLGDYPLAEPVVIIDETLAHRYVGVRTLNVIDLPIHPDQAPPLSEALPLFAIDRREWIFCEGAHPAVIARDGRCAPGGHDPLPGAESSGV